MKPIRRWLEDRVLQSLQAFPVVYIAGPRQSGKTTLVQHIADALYPMRYVTFDDIQMRSAAQRDPEAFLRGFNKPVILDEVQMVPEIFRPLKIMVDERRGLSDGGKGRFLLTGSASVMALPQLSDALVGRMVLHQLLPFSVCEIQTSAQQDFIQNLWSTTPWFHQADLPETDLDVISRATFPELAALDQAEWRYQWCNGYLNTVLQCDVRLMMEIDKIAHLPNLLGLLASRVGGTLNEAALSRAAELNHVTTKKYRTLLDHLFLTLSVPAWSTHLGKRLVKSPKIYLYDIHLLTHLLHVTLDQLEQSHPVLFGHVLENVVAVELSKQLTFSRVHARLYHYRRHSGQEVDFLLEGPQGRVVAIEVKASRRTTNRDFRHLETLKHELGSKFHRGLVLYQGSERLPYGDDLWALPLSALWSS